MFCSLLWHIETYWNSVPSYDYRICILYLSSRCNPSVPFSRSETEETNRRKILGEILSSCLLETGWEYFTRCIIWMYRCFAKFTIAQAYTEPVFRYSVPLSFKILSSLHFSSPLSSNILFIGRAHAAHAAARVLWWRCNLRRFAGRMS